MLKWDLYYFQNNFGFQNNWKCVLTLWKLFKITLKASWIRFTLNFLIKCLGEPKAIWNYHFLLNENEVFFPSWALKIWRKHEYNSICFQTNGIWVWILKYYQTFTINIMAESFWEIKSIISLFEYVFICVLAIIVITFVNFKILAKFHNP